MSGLARVFADAGRLGYGLQALLPSARLPGGCGNAEGFSHLWLVCNAGARVQRRWLAGRDPESLLPVGADPAPGSCGPLDDFCRAELGGLLGGRGHRFLYPRAAAEPQAPLVAILAAAGLHRPSPLMQALHWRFGTWWAVRALIAVNAGAGEMIPDAVAEPLGVDPCPGCDRPCIRACPAGAVGPGSWHWRRCTAYRLEAGSACRRDCPARVACPVGAAFRYPVEVRAYHYGISRRFLEGRRT